ncbi:hypothetical protein AB0F15_14580 [Amycolatopsis sp. NPDC026612]|uniref:hypothetical protein n=1 Tax=Amycolatopsis sp. NPDC026612 TaxID=3155466 RepID=UPI0033D79C79
MSKIRRVAVTSPQTRLAHARRRSRGRWRQPRLPAGDTQRATALYTAQRRGGIPALVLMFVLLLGLPGVFALFPALDTARLLGIPLSWLLLAVLPYPAMALLARWQLRRAERVEDD